MFVHVFVFGVPPTLCGIQQFCRFRYTHMLTNQPYYDVAFSIFLTLRDYILQTFVNCDECLNLSQYRNKNRSTFVFSAGFLLFVILLMVFSCPVLLCLGTSTLIDAAVADNCTPTAAAVDNRIPVALAALVLPW